jgi:molybdate transport system ATP-binding protein
MKKISLQQVCVQIDGHSRLHDITLTMAPGQCWAVLGANGSGKSAFGLLLCGELAPTTGTTELVASSAYVSFEKVTRLLDYERYHDDSNNRGGADPGTLLRDYILRGLAGREDRLAELARQFSIVPLLDRGIKFLSTGEMRKAVICRAVLQEPQLLVLDEPFDGLDSAATATLKALVGTIIDNGTRVVLLLNRFSEILPAVSHVAYLQQGTIMTTGPVAQITSSSVLRRFHGFHRSDPLELPPPPPLPGLQPVPPGAPLIAMRNVRVSYADKIILNNLTWTVNQDEHWQISGPNGAGKSTLLNLISGDNTQAYANDISLFGRKKGSGESVWEIKQRIGMVSTHLQRSYRVAGTTLSVIVSGFFDSIGVYRNASAEQVQIARRWLAIIGMAEHARTPFGQLSFGEQRLVLLARAMIKQPQLLILDEPCQGLDDMNRAMILKLIDNLGRAGTTRILYVTHHPEDRIPCINRHLELVPSPCGAGSTARIAVHESAALPPRSRRSRDAQPGH